MNGKVGKKYGKFYPKSVIPPDVNGVRMVCFGGVQMTPPHVWCLEF